MSTPSKSRTETKTTLEKVGISFKNPKTKQTVTKELINSFAQRALTSKSDSLTNPDEFLNKFAADFEFAAETYRDLIITGKETIKDLIEIANESGNARAFEVVGQLIKTVGEVNEKMINSYKTTKEIVAKTAKSDPTGNPVPSTAVAIEGNAIFFTGTTADLIKQLDAEIPGLSEETCPSSTCKNYRCMISFKQFRTKLNENSEQVHHVIEELHNHHPVNPVNPKERILQIGGKKCLFKFASMFGGYFLSHAGITQGSFEVDHRQGRLRIRSIHADSPHNGIGSLLLKRILRTADKHKVTTELTASSKGHHALSSDQLRSWYGKHGFTNEPGYDEALGYMIRHPK